MISDDELRELLRAHILAEHKTAYQFAKANGMHRGYLSDMLLGRCVVSVRVANILGYRRVVGYEKHKKRETK